MKTRAGRTNSFTALAGWAFVLVLGTAIGSSVVAQGQDPSLSAMVHVKGDLTLKRTWNLIPDPWIGPGTNSSEPTGLTPQELGLNGLFGSNRNR